MGVGRYRLSGGGRGGSLLLMNVAGCVSSSPQARCVFSGDREGTDGSA